MDSRLLLPKDTLLDSAYRVTRVLGAGGFGITYEAEDVQLGNSVALKEYYPFEFGDRDSTMSVRARSERHRKTFEWGRASFLQEARMLARFDHRSIVRVARVFEANATAYMVMRLEQGLSFEAWLESLGRAPTQEELDRITTALLDALEIMHAENFLHRDIAPDNIIVRADGSPVLLDFGAARRAVGEMSRMLTGIVKAGYSPQEQYATDGRLQGPWTDFYALGGVLYRAIAGGPPEEATLRAMDDRMAPAAMAAKASYRPGFLAAIDACLSVKPADRPQSVVELRALLQGEVPEAKPMRQPLAAAGNRQVAHPAALGARPAAKRWLAAAASLALAGGAYGGFEYTRWSGEQDRKLAAEAKHRQDERIAAEARTADERVRREAEAKRVADTAAMESVRKEAEAKRLADAAAARKKTEDEALAKVHAEAKRLQDEQLAADKRAAEERARRDAEAKRVADAAAMESARKDAEAKRLADAAAIRREAEGNQAAQAERDFQDGERYLYGRGVPRDYLKAKEAYEKSAAAGHNGGMTGLGWIYENGLSVPKDFAKARELYEKATAAGNPYAMTNLGRLYRNGWSVPRDYAKARELFEKAVAVGNSAGMYNLGWLYHNGWGVPRDYAKARDLYEKAMAKGNGLAMNALGVLYRDALGVPRDYAKARDLFERAATTGYDFGMHNLGWLHENGWGVPHDYAKAREWYEKAAASGNSVSMANLGWLYRQGLGGAQDFAKAREWSEKSAALGNGGGMNNLGVFHEYGNGVPQSYLKAREWYEKAAAAGHTFGMRNLARMLDQGFGGSPDHARAAKLLLEAARQSNHLALEDLRGQMAKWSAKMRNELKRELFTLGFYKGAVHDTWDNDTRAAVEKMLAAGK